MSRHLLCLSLGALIAGGFAAPVATAADQPPATHDNCFYLRDFEDWKSPSPEVIYLRVGASQFYRFDLAQPANALKYSDVRIVNRRVQSDWVCSPRDLDLLLTSRSGDIQPLFVKAISKLTPDEVAAIPEKFRP